MLGKKINVKNVFFHVHFSNPWHAFASHGLPAIAELLVYPNNQKTFVNVNKKRYALFTFKYRTVTVLLAFDVEPIDYITDIN